MSNKIERQVHYMTAPAFSPEDKTGINNTWNYNRAPEGMLFILDRVQISCVIRDSLHTGVFAVFDGHEYTHWNIFPGVQSNETLVRCEMNPQTPDILLPLDNWECKEYTLGIRSQTETYGFKVSAIVWYYLKDANRMELMEYAIKHPKNEDMFKRILRGTTVEPTEAGT